MVHIYKKKLGIQIVLFKVLQQAKTTQRVLGAGRHLADIGAETQT